VDRRFVLFASLVAFVTSLLLLPLPLAEQVENRVYDLCFQLAHRWSVGRVEAAPQIGFVAIDDRSVNPDYSPFSSKYGDDGWRTRDAWDLHLEQMGQIYYPKVLAYDILFSPISTQPPPEDWKRVPGMRDLEKDGNLEFQNTLINYAEARAQGQPAPRALFAYYFPDNVEGSADLTDAEKQKQEQWFKKLDRFRLPEGSVLPGGKLPVFHTVWLPMDVILSAPSYYLGPINIKPDADGVFRRAPLVYAYQPPGSAEVRYVPSFALEAFLLWLDVEPQDLKPPGGGLPSLAIEPGGDLKVATAQGEWTMPVDDKFQMTIVPRFKFSGSRAHPTASAQKAGAAFQADNGLFKPPFVDLLKEGSTVPMEANHYKDLTKGRILVVGEAYTGGTDLGNFPLEQSAPRALMHLNILNNIFQHDHLAPVAFIWKILICAALAAIMALLYTWTPVRLAGLWSVSLLVCYPVIAGVALVSQNVELPLFAPTFITAFCFATNSFHIYQMTRRGREAMRQLFSKVTSPRVLRLLEENPAAFYVHRKTQATLLFSDVEGFTTLAEKLDPGFLAALINRYLSPMTAAIVRQDGYLIQYAGDGIMAVWGVPLDDEQHAYKACVAAWDHIQAAEELRETLPDGAAYRFGVRIGVNTGTVSAGNMGSDQKLQYTVMGDEVNLAARLEPTNKDYGSKIIIGPLTYTLAKDRIRARILDKIVVKGKKEAVTIYELLGIGAAPPDAWATLYEKGLECLWRRQWDEADRYFEQADQLRGGDKASKLQQERTRHYRANPPGENWQGAFTRLAKD
jgi:adenylate cyclase